MRHGRVRRGRLGIAAGTLPLPRRWVRENGWPAATAVQIKEVVQGGAADQAGLKAGDWIVGVDGTTMSDLSDVLKLLSGDGANRTLAVRVLRSSGGVLKPVHALLTPRPQ
jgi:S1-C subfamily serine protease